MLDAPIQNPFGINIRNTPITVTVRGGAVVLGQVVAFDLVRTYATGAYGTHTGPLSIVRGVYSGAQKYGILGIVLAAAADQKQTKVMVEGLCDALCQGDLGSISSGVPLFVDSGGTYLRDGGSSGHKCLGSAQSAVSTPATPRLTPVLFSGLYGAGAYG